jgi:hypothetical protein
MRTTVRVDDEILEQLKVRAREENISLTRLINRTLQAGLRTAATHRPKRSTYRERTYALGAPRASMDKALAIAAALEDDEIVRELALRK